MKIIIALLLLTLTACSIRDCKVDPTLEITQKNTKDTGTDKNISMGTVQDLARDATKGGQITCRF